MAVALPFVEKNNKGHASKAVNKAVSDFVHYVCSSRYIRTLYIDGLRTAILLSRSSSPTNLPSTYLLSFAMANPYVLVHRSDLSHSFHAMKKLVSVNSRKHRKIRTSCEYEYPTEAGSI